MSEQENVALVQRGFEAFNSADIATLREMFVEDAHQHIPGNSQFAGDYNGRDNILELPDGKFADLLDGPDDLAAWDDFWG